MRGRAPSRAALLLPLLLALAACGGSEPDRSAALTPASPRARPPEPRGAPDPRVAGISDLARMSRYVFREMQLRREECRLADPLATAVDYTIEVEVESGAVRSAGLAGAEVTLAGVKLPLSRDEWPPELERRVACLVPHLGRMEMAPAPADGRYETRFSLAAPPAAEPARAPARPEGPPDPTEPGLPDQVRLARYVFGEMLRSQADCPLQGPSGARLRYVLEVEVRGRAVVRSKPLRADPEGAAGLMTEDWFRVLSSYSACLEPRLRDVRMDPAPADGVYRLTYTTPGRAAPAGP